MLAKWYARFVAKAVLFGLVAHIHIALIADGKYQRKSKYINFEKRSMKCKKCKYYYRTMASGQGYNPAPYCHYYEETGKRPNILTQDCYKKDQKRGDFLMIKFAVFLFLSFVSFVFFLVYLHRDEHNNIIFSAFFWWLFSFASVIQAATIGILK